jgi:predicted nicotinamide N-methyase
VDAVDWVEEVVGLHGRDLRLRRPRDADALLTEAAFERDEYLPYWADLWPSSIALARVLSARAFKGAPALELGCGLGLPSLAAAAAGARVLAVDWSADAVAATQANAERNDLAIETLVCSWTEPGPLLARGPWPVVLAADVLYEVRNAHALLDLLPRLLAPRGECWIADPGRPPALPFFRDAEQAFTVEKRPDPGIPQGGVYRLRPR